MKKDIRAVFFDIDGTLVSFENHRVPQSTVDALAALRRKGVKTFIATGRMLPSIAFLDHIPFDGYITYNGAYCTTAGGEVVFSNPLPAEDLRALAAHLENDGFAVAYMKRHEMTVNRVDESVQRVAEVIDVPVPRIQAPHEAAKEEVLQICIYVDPEKEREVMAGVLTGCESNRWSPIFADINRRGNTKRTGIDRMLEHYGIAPEHTMAFGDGGNDVHMLRHVAVGVAMGNAGDDAKAAADHVTDTVDNDGIAKALRHFGVI